jgi:molybdopterin converting factor small subunit
MAKVKFTSALTRFFPSLTEMEVPGDSVMEALFHIEQRFPGMLSYLTEENGQLRKHVNIFLKGELIKDRVTLKDSLTPRDELLIFQALSGG